MCRSLIHGGGDWGPSQISEGAPVCYPLAWLIAVASLACFFFSILFFDFPIPSRPRSLFTHQYFLPSLCFSRLPVPPPSLSVSEPPSPTDKRDRKRKKKRESGRREVSPSAASTAANKQTLSPPSLFFSFSFSFL